MNTNLLGREIKQQYSGASGTIVAVFLDRGELWLAVENPDGVLYNMIATCAQLEQEEE